MRYKVIQTETVEYVLEAVNEEEARDFINSYTTRELRAVKPDIKTTYSESIVEKTVMPADFNVDDDIEMILDDWPGYYKDEDENVKLSIGVDSIQEY